VTDRAVIALARAVGLQVDWHDAHGTPKRVSSETLRAVLSAIGFPAGTRAEIVESRARISQDKRGVPPLLVARPGARVRVATDARAIEMHLESGERQALVFLASPAGGVSIRVPPVCGYHTLRAGDRECRLAVAPRRCFGMDDLRLDARLAGIAVQIYALHGGTTRGFGDFAALGEFAAEAGAHGIDAVMTNPFHAQFAARPGHISPYAPSTRLFLNALYAEGPSRSRPGNRSALIDWRRSSVEKYATLRASFERLQSEEDRSDFERFCANGGVRLFEHALFEALDAHFCAQGISGQRDWPEPFNSPAAPGAKRFAAEQPREIRYHQYLQWLASRSLSSAQDAARDRMAIGLIADMAVGMDPQGSHAWSAPSEILKGLHVGAPPDIYNTAGQDWGLTALSPAGLRATGYTAFIETLRAGMRHAGGIRIDHAMGLQRIWVIPEGASPGDGVYLHLPQKDLMGLIALESRRHRAIVVGEDLGTVPHGFREHLERAGIMGMQVLWFERSRKGSFVRPSLWRREAVAMTTTHDLPTVAGWWTERDIDWRARVSGLSETAAARDRRNRRADRKTLWAAFLQAKCAKAKEPRRADPRPAVDAAAAYVGSSTSALAIIPLEDLTAEAEQPNLPGTIDAHPNWRRRDRLRAPFDDPDVLRRVKRFVTARRTS
jgi:4-alpha-glucanotransferase